MKYPKVTPNTLILNHILTNNPWNREKNIKNFFKWIIMKIQHIKICEVQPLQCLKENA